MTDFILWTVLPLLLGVFLGQLFKIEIHRPQIIDIDPEEIE